MDHLTDQLGLIPMNEKMQQGREPQQASWRVKKQVWGAGQGLDRPDLEMQKGPGRA